MPNRIHLNSQTKKPVEMPHPATGGDLSKIKNMSIPNVTNNSGSISITEVPGHYGFQRTTGIAGTASAKAITSTQDVHKEKPRLKKFLKKLKNFGNKVAVFGARVTLVGLAAWGAKAAVTAVPALGIMGGVALIFAGIFILIPIVNRLIPD